MARGRTWTDDDTGRLRRLVRSGAIDAEIARAMGCRRETITHKRKLLGLPPACSAAHRRGVLGRAARRALGPHLMERAMATASPRPAACSELDGLEICRRLAEASRLGLLRDDPPVDPPVLVGETMGLPG